MDAFSSALMPLAVRLGYARRRATTVLLVQALIWAGAAGLFGFIASEIVSHISIRFTFELAGIDSAWWVALGAFVVVLTIGTVVATTRRPDLIEMARRADALLRLDERTSTALEVDALHRDSSSVVIDALRRDAARHADLLEPRSLAPLRPSRVLFAYPVLIALAVLLAMLPLPVAVTPTATASATLTVAEQQDLSTKIDLVADLVERQQATRRSEVLQGVARTLRALSDQVASGAPIDREDLMSQLQSLGDYAAAEVANSNDAQAEKIPALLDALKDRVGAAPQQPAPQSAPAPDSLGPQSDAGPQPDTAGQEGQPRADNPSDPGNSPERALPDNLDELLKSMSPDGGKGAPARSNDQGQVAVPGYFKPGPRPPVPLTADDAAVDPKGGQLAGPATESKAGNSVLAGQGTDDLTGDAKKPTVTFENNVDLTLAAKDTGKGKRIEAQVTPQTTLTPITEELLKANVAAWQRAPESAVGRVDTGFENRDLVSAYMLDRIGPPA